jgi:hypothetical protein
MKKVTHLDARLSVAFKIPVRRLNRPVVVELRFLHIPGHRLAFEFFEHWLVIKRIDMRHPAAHVEKDDAASFRREALRAIHQRCGSTGLFLHQSRQSSETEPGGRACKKLTAIHVFHWR